MGSVQTVSVLFTDLVGSTALESEIGPAASDRLREEHFGLLRAAISKAGGTEVKNLGDGLMAAFVSAVAAVDCAVEMQRRLEQRNRRSDQQLAVRIGLSLGDADHEGDDYFGSPVIEAARLCAKAQGGQILCTELLRMMAAGRSAHPFEPVGELELKGLPEPMRAFQVSWEPVDAIAAMPLPPFLRGVPPMSYVGREEEREALKRVFEQAVEGACALALISGEAGIGKTRLATLTALEAHADGSTVLYGRSEEGLGAPYGVWVEALRHWALEAAESDLRAHVARHGGELGRLLPDLSRRLSDLPAPTASDPETERYMLFGAVSGLLAQLAADRPLVVLLDDLHWADKGSLLLLRYLVGQGVLAGVVLLGTYRSSDIFRGHPLVDVLAALRRVDGVERIDLTGLGDLDVIELMQTTAGHDLDADGLALAAEIVRETDGNPFFVGEILRHLRQSGSLAQDDSGRWRLQTSLEQLGLPESVREVVSSRVARLDPDAGSVLRAAAVIGQEFDLDLLMRVTGRTEDQLLDLLEKAVEASVISESSERAGRFVFAHALVNHTLYDELGPTRRARTHRLVAEALEELAGPDPGERVEELARHWALATEATEVLKAVEYARLAGERALGALAPDEALRWFTRALELFDGHRELDPELRRELLIGLGESQRQAGERAFRKTLLKATSVALDSGDSERAARAVLANNRGRSSVYGDVDEERVELLEKTIASTVTAQGAMRARLLSLLALELVFEPGYERRRALSDEALELAIRSGDERVLGQVLRDRVYTIWAPGALQERRANLDRLAELAERVEDPVLRYWAYDNDVDVRAEAGELSAATAALGRATAVAEHLRQPSLLWHAAYHDACLGLLVGGLSEAERLAKRGIAIGTDCGEPDALGMGSTQISVVRWCQGRYDEAVRVVESIWSALPRLAVMHAAIGIYALEAGSPDRARQVLDEAKARGIDQIPRDSNATTTAATYAMVATGLRDVEAAAALSRQLAATSESVVWNGDNTIGAIDVFRGLTAGLLGRRDEADARITAGIELNDRIGARVWAVRGRLYLAELVADQDDARATRLLTQARDDADALGAAPLVQRAEAGLAQLTRA